MHDRLAKSDFMELHVATLLREGRGEPRPNRRFGMTGRESSPIRKYARRRFRESVLGMVSGVYKAESDRAEDRENL